jgi:hypothetical protein
MQIPLGSQLLFTQSDACSQVRRSLQRPQRSPPQSGAVSVPFCRPSSQRPGSAQRPAAQNPVWHCASSVQALSSGHPPQSALPQSTAVSPPFLTLSLQLGSWQQRASPAPQPIG